MNTHNTFQDPCSDLTVMVITTGPVESGELLPWVTDPNWQPPAEWNLSKEVAS